MTDKLFLITYIVAFILYILYLKHIISINKKSIIIPYIVSYLIINYLGILILYFNLDDYRIYLGVTDRNIVLLIFIYSIISSWIIILTHGLFVIKNNSQIKENTSSFKMHCIGLFFVVILLLIYLLNLEQVALIEAILANDNVHELRSKMGNDNDSSHWIRLLINVYLVYFGFYFNIKFEKNNFIRLILNIFVIFFLMLTTSKFPAILYLVCLFSLSIRKNNLDYKKIMKLAIVLVLSISLMYIYFTNINNIGSLVKASVSRILTGSIAPSYFYISYILEDNDFLYGKSLPNPAGILPFNSISISVFIMDWWFNSNTSIVGSSPTAYWAEAYVNFGLIGIIIFSFILGGVVSIIDRYVNNIKSTHTEAMYAFFVGFVISFNLTGFSEIIKPLFICSIFSLVLLNRISWKK